jgi:hypothetical protein
MRWTNDNPQRVLRVHARQSGVMWLHAAHRPQPCGQWALDKQVELQLSFLHSCTFYSLTIKLNEGPIPNRARRSRRYGGQCCFPPSG